MVNDPKGIKSTSYAEKGEIVYAFARSAPEDGKIIFSPQWPKGSMVSLYGGNLVDLMDIIKSLEGGVDRVNLSKRSKDYVWDLGIVYSSKVLNPGGQVEIK